MGDGAWAVEDGAGVLRARTGCFFLTVPLEPVPLEPLLLPLAVTNEKLLN